MDDFLARSRKAVPALAEQALAQTRLIGPDVVKWISAVLGAIDKKIR